jgi:hypothetical protein
LDFDIHLTFACLREAASAKAGILKFGFLSFSCSDLSLSIDNKFGGGQLLQPHRAKCVKLGGADPYL